MDRNMQSSASPAEAAGAPVPPPAGATAPTTPRSAIPTAADSGMEQSDPRRIVGVIISHWWLVLLVLLLASAIGAILCIVIPPKYRATCRYEVVVDERLRISSQQQAYAPPTQDQTLRQRGRQILILTGKNIQQQVLAKLASRWQGRIAENEMVPSVIVKPASRELETMLEISVDAADGEYALDFLKELRNQYEEVQRTRALETNEYAMRNLWVEKKRLSDELEEAQKNLTDFQKEHNIRFNEAKAQYDDAFLAGLVQRQNALRMERTMLETQFPFVQNANTATLQDVLSLTMETHGAVLSGSNGGMDAITPESVTEGLTKNIPTAQKLREIKNGNMSAPPASWQEQEELVSRLEAEYQDMLTSYKSDHPKMLDLRRQIDSAKRELQFGATTALKRLKSRYEAIKIQEAALGEAAARWKSEINMSAADRATYDSIRSKVDHLKQLHDQVYARILDGATQNVVATFNNTIDPPTTIKRPVSPNRLLIMTVAIAGGLLLGIGLAVLLDYLDTSIMDVMAIEERLGIPYLSSIPSWIRVLPNVDMSNAKVIVDRNKASLATEVYRSLRTSVEAIIGGKKGYALALTSTEANEGKSLTVVNLATALSWTGRKILIVDGDLRRGRLHENIGVEQHSGLTELLLGKIADWHEVVLTTPVENLSIIPVGSYNNSAPELLDSTRMKQLVQEWGREFDVIIFDTAPIGRVIDAALIGRACDGVLLVARHGICTLAGVRHGVSRMKNVNIIGFVINGIDTSGKQGYANYYGYFRRFSRYGRYYGHYAYYNNYYDHKYDRYGYEPDAEKNSTDSAPTSPQPPVS